MVVVRPRVIRFGVHEANLWSREFLQPGYKIKTHLFPLLSIHLTKPSKLMMQTKPKQTSRPQDPCFDCDPSDTVAMNDSAPSIPLIFSPGLITLGVLSSFGPPRERLPVMSVVQKEAT
jgi:hypothetical protein